MKRRLKLVDWIEINTEEYESTIQKMIQFVSITKNIPPHLIEEWDIDRLMNEYSSTKWLDSPINVSDSVNEIKLGDISLHLIDFNTITFGQFIDLEWCIDNNYIENIGSIAATLYTQMEKERFKKAIYEKYSEIDVDERADYFMENIFIDEIYGTIQSFLKWRDNIFASYSFWDDSLSDIDPEELNEEELEIYNEEKERLDKSRQTMWEDMLSLLSGGDITKYEEILGTNIFMVFNRIAKTVEENRNQTKTK